MVKRRYQHHSSAVRTREDLEMGQDENLPRQEFEFDDSPEASPEIDNLVIGLFTQLKMSLLSGLLMGGLFFFVVPACH